MFRHRCISPMGLCNFKAILATVLGCDITTIQHVDCSQTGTQYTDKYFPGENAISPRKSHLGYYPDFDWIMQHTILPV